MRKWVYILASLLLAGYVLASAVVVIVQQSSTGGAGAGRQSMSFLLKFWRRHFARWSINEAVAWTRANFSRGVRRALKAARYGAWRASPELFRDATCWQAANLIHLIADRANIPFVRQHKFYPINRPAGAAHIVIIADIPDGRLAVAAPRCFFTADSLPHAAYKFGCIFRESYTHVDIHTQRVLREALKRAEEFPS